MSSAKDTFVKMLKTAHQSVTSVRVAVFEALLGQEPLSMHELVKRAGKVDRASVYRTIDLFERLGIAQRLNTGWKYKIELSDRFSEHHHHLTCTQCGKTIDMNESELETLISRLVDEYNFTPTAHQIEIQGTCYSCHSS